MKDNKGFTLVEIISVIAILAIIIVIAIPTINIASTNVKKKTLQTKVDNIEKAAVLYGQNHREYFTVTCASSGDPCYGLTEECKCYGKTYKDTSSPPNTKTVTTITVSKLINPSIALTVDSNYTETDIDPNEKGYINTDDDSGDIINPVDDTQSLINCEIQLYKKYGKIYAIYKARDDTSDKTCWY